MKSKTISLFAISISLIGIFLVLSGDKIAAQGEKSIASVEVGLAEVSPRGAAGGYAVPASGGSNPPPVPGSITIAFTPTTIAVGKEAELSWKWSRATGKGLEQVTISRCKSAGSTASNCPEWVNVISLEGSKFGGGQTTFKCFLFLTCHNAIEKGTSPLFDAKTKDLTPGTYVYKALGRFSTGAQTSTATLTVEGSAADLAVSIPLFSDESSLTGNSAAFTAGVKNIGTASTGKAFANKFEYRWGDGAWAALGSPNSPALAKSAFDTFDSQPITLRKNGILEVRVCTDTANVIPELSESNNCASSGPLNMATLFPGLVPAQFTQSGSGKTGENQIFRGVAWNAGTGASPASSVRFCIAKSNNDNCANSTGNAISTQLLPALPAGEFSDAFSINWKGVAGTHTAYFCVVGESCLSFGITISDNPPDTTPQSAVRLTADETKVRKGDKTTLRWDAGNSTCTLSGTNGLRATGLTGAGITPSGVINEKTTFSLNCTRGSQTASAQPVTVNIIPTIIEI